MARGRHHSHRILEIDFTIDKSSDIIVQIDALTFYRDSMQRRESAGYSVSGTWADGEGGTKNALNAGTATTAVGSAEKWIFLGEQIPPPSVIVLDEASQS